MNVWTAVRPSTAAPMLLGSWPGGDIQP
jgi:hypothetical protein